jgi:methyl-accepting chemotaxis protein
MHSLKLRIIIYSTKVAYRSQETSASKYQLADISQQTSASRHQPADISQQTSASRQQRADISQQTGRRILHEMPYYQS